MKHEVVVSLTGSFESHAQETEGGAEFWLARNVQHLPGYAEWRDLGAVGLGSARDFATKITIHNARKHSQNNRAVRNTLLNRGIRPENPPPAEAVRKVERRLVSETKNSQ